MKNEVFKIIGVGAFSGFVFTLALSGIAITFEALYAIIFWDTPLIDIVKGMPSYAFNYITFLVLPITIICALTSIPISIILLAKRYLKEGWFILICVTICFVIATLFYKLTTDMIVEPDKLTRDYLNFIFRKLPSALFIVCGYFFSRYIYRNSHKLPDG